MEFSKGQIRRLLIGNAIFLFFCIVLLGGDLNNMDGQIFSNQENKNVLENQAGFIITKADSDVDLAEAILINLSEIESGYEICEKGNYLLKGQLDGQLCVNAEEQVVHLILDEVLIHSMYGPAIFIRSAGKVIITIKDDTNNLLRDSGMYSTSGDENACIYSNCDITFNGTGSLDIYGYYKDGIHSKDIVKILGGKITIQAKRDGVRGNDGILICNEKLDIESEGTGLHTTKIRKPANGSIEIRNGSHSIISGRYAIYSSGDFYVENCTIYEKGVIANFCSEGNSYVQEGCFINEP